MSDYSVIIKVKISMARPLSPEKHSALLQSATQAVAEQGVLATTSAIARHAGVAEGTLFTYFGTKDALFQALYAHLKQSLSDTMMRDYPHQSGLFERLQHVFESYVNWGLANPQSRSAVARLSASGLVSPETLALVTEPFLPVYRMMEEGAQQAVLVDAPIAFLFAIIEDIADVTIHYIGNNPAEEDRFRSLGVKIAWRAVTR